MVRGRCSSAVRPCTRPRSRSRTRPAAMLPRCSRPPKPMWCSIREPGCGRWAGDPDTALSWAQVAGHTSGGSLIADVSFSQERPTFPFGTHVSVVEVDTETGRTKMLRHVTVDDARIG